MSTRPSRISVNVRYLERTTLEIMEGSGNWKTIGTFELPLPSQTECLDKTTTSVYITDEGVLGPKPENSYLTGLITNSNFYKQHLSQFDKPFFQDQKTFNETELKAYSCQQIVVEFTRKVRSEFRDNPANVVCTQIRRTKGNSNKTDPNYLKGEVFGLRLTRAKAGEFGPEGTEVGVGNHDRVKWLDRETAANTYHPVASGDGDTAPTIPTEASYPPATQVSRKESLPPETETQTNDAELAAVIDPRTESIRRGRDPFGFNDKLSAWREGLYGDE